MIAKMISNNFMSRVRMQRSIRNLGLSLLSALMSWQVQAGPTALATEPFLLSTKINALPNVMFVLDDSGSMRADYLPDWAGPYQATISSVLTTVTPEHRFFNGAYNGVAYNPATRYRPPVMYTNTGALDTTTYPSMTGRSVATGGDASATASAPNWRAVKVDGYGIQSTATANLEGRAFSYTTIPGEYCDSVQLRNCVASSTPTGAYTFPAQLRWCTTSIKSTDTTANAGTACQAANIADTPTNTTNGVTPYTFPRMPKPRTSTITLSAAGTVTNITVDGLRILSADATGGSNASLAIDIAAKINACSFLTTGNCAIAGYSAVVLGSVVTVTAPGATTATPVVTGVASTVTAFSGGSVPGSSVLTVIKPGTAAITFTAAGGTVTGLSVSGQNILSASASGLSATDLATDVAVRINACAGAIVGSCTISGYSATSSNGVVLISAPYSAALATPVVTGAVATVSAFSGGNYPYPGATVKDTARTDCAGSVCTFEEEMVNYANWYAYYHTRMQMMKTASSIAFSSVDDKFRVGYFSINNGAGHQYLNLAAFDGVQKNLWYSKFLSAVPFGATPLRTGLSTVGRMYAGMLNSSSLNDETVNEPMEYSCQQNFTILSTDGYWNDTSNPKQLDGTTDIGQQDGSLDRPYYDGGQQTRTVSQTLKSEEQIGINTFLLESMTRQQQASTERLEEVVTTTKTYPWKEQITTLQTQTTPLTRSTYNLESRTYPLTSTTKQLQESVYKIESTTRPLERYTYNLTETTTPLQRIITNITVTTYPLQTGTEKINSTTYPLQTGTEKINSITYPLQLGTEKINSTTSPLQKLTQTINSTTSPLQSSTYMIRKSTRQLQKRMETSSDGGDTWDDTDWVDASSCETRASGPGWVRNTQCRYNSAADLGGQTSCTVIAADATSPYDVPQAVTCAYETTPVVSNASTCTVRAQSASFAHTQIACGYGAPAAAVPGLSSCSALDQTSQGTMTGDKVVCAYDAAAWVNSGTCTADTPANYSGAKISCRYGSAGSPVTGLSSCTARDQPTTGAMSGDKVVCGYDAKSWVNSATCTPDAPANYAGHRITCRYRSTSSGSSTGLASCTARDQPTTGAMSGDKVVCGYDAIAWANSANCTPNAPANYAGHRITCGYGSTSNGTSTGLASCTAKDQPTTAAMSGDKVVCGYDTIAWANSASCTPNAPANYSGHRITCGYRSTASSSPSGQTACTPRDQPTTAAMSGDRVLCAYDASPASTTTVTSCTWNVSATASTPRVQCSYNAGAATSNANLATCTAVNQSTGTANGTVWSGPAVACAYQTALVASNLTTCSPTGSVSTGPVFNAYTTCGYGAGSLATGLNSCLLDPPETGPNYTQGQTVACAYSTTYATRTNVAACTPVAQSSSYAAPQTTCTYEAVGTSATNLGSCTAVPQSSTAPFVGPNVACAYSTTATTNLNVSTCSANRQTSSPYSGPAVDCSYNATPTVTTGLTSCTAQAEAGPVFSNGAKTTCAYGTPTAWSNATATCTTAAQSAGPTNYSQEVACRYSTPAVENLVATCLPEALESTASPYTQLVAKRCVSGTFVDPVVTTVTATVDSCSTAPTHTGDPSTVQVDTATTCTYLPASIIDSPSCTAGGGPGSPVSTTRVTCPVTNAAQAYVPVASCTPAGTLPLNFDTSGKVVVCRKTDQIGTTSAAEDYATFSVLTSQPTDSCTAGVSAGVHTLCPVLLSTGPTPVNPTSCVSALPIAGNSYVRTTCTPTSTSSTVMGCGPQAPADPLWQTVTCANIAGRGTSDTLADVAAYYYYNDLRTSVLGNCTGAVVPPATAGSVLCTATEPMNNVPTSLKDPNPAQHMTTFTLGLGASGYMKYSNSYISDTTGDYATVYGTGSHTAAEGITADPANGVCSWQAGGLCNWPYPTSDEQTTIDDLWHAGVNGHGAYFSATDPKSLATSISDALSGVGAAGGASASPTLSNPNLTPGDNYVFSSTYTTYDWTGEVVRLQLDPYTGNVLNVDWGVQAKLDAKSHASRAIYTFDSSVASTKLKAFNSTNFASNAYFQMPHISTAPNGLTQFLCASVDTCLTASDQTAAAGANLVNFLRGDRTNEGAVDVNGKYYRQRQHVLGDMVNAQAVYVSKPLYNFGDPGYSAFVTAKQSRQAVVYVGANDGMLHAFAAKGTSTTEALVDAAAAARTEAYLDPTNTTKAGSAASANADAATALATDTVVGQELWAYIPTMVMPHLYKLADKKYKDKHRYYVDSTPVVGDICVSDCTTAATAVWKTILVGGLGRGGRGYYALDITDPASPKALWEFTDNHMGYTYGLPQIAKMSNGTWVVLLTSGYNNIPNDDASTGDGVGRLYVLNANTGAPIGGVSPISTGAGSVAQPSGLAMITAEVVNPTSDATIEAVYGGDLDGNFWRFDVNGTIGASGHDAQLLAILKDGSGNTQPVTVKPEVTFVDKYNVNVVYVGTGRFLAASDATDTSQQSFYAIKDARATGTTPGTAIFDNPGGNRSGIRSAAGFVRQVHSEIDCPADAAARSICELGTKVRKTTAYPVDLSSDNGWFVDLIGSAERANTDPDLALGIIAFNTNMPSLAACDIGGKSYQYALDYLTGGPIRAPGNYDPVTDSGYAGKFLADELASGVTLAITKSGDIKAISGTSGGRIDVSKKVTSPEAALTRRTAWRELIRE